MLPPSTVQEVLIEIRNLYFRNDAEVEGVELFDPTKSGRLAWAFADNPEASNIDNCLQWGVKPPLEVGPSKKKRPAATLLEESGSLGGSDSESHDELDSHNGTRAPREEDAAVDQLTESLNMDVE